MPGSCDKLETKDRHEIFLCYLYNRYSSWRDKGVFIT